MTRTKPLAVRVHRNVILPIAQDEHSCLKCFETVRAADGMCYRCGGRKSIPAKQVLLVDEYAEIS